MLDYKHQEKEQYVETKLSKWIFRFCALAGIFAFIYFVIHLEFRELKKNNEARISA